MSAPTVNLPAGVVLRWETPPPADRRYIPPQVRESRWSPLASVLRSHTGRWAVIFEGDESYARRLAGRISHGEIREFTPSGDFEAVSRKHRGRTATFARYVGDPSAGELR
jgi:hypothetical protein